MLLDELLWHKFIITSDQYDLQTHGIKIAYITIHKHAKLLFILKFDPDKFRKRVHFLDYVGLTLRYISLSLKLNNIARYFSFNKCVNFSYLSAF